MRVMMQCSRGGATHLEYVEADVAVLVHVGVVAGRVELDGGGGEGVVTGEAQRQLVRQALVHLHCITTADSDCWA